MWGLEILADGVIENLVPDQPTDRIIGGHIDGGLYHTVPQVRPTRPPTSSCPETWPVAWLSTTDP